ncbi:MAG TPA: UDP-N-acetylmuramoyl-tripeptide--D-alanyl-D-alanine ligase [Luteimonas sp.]|nr:UDP-N-acetylmuramoyl-tripeptide--D-alanyl-D-alanine ligase [Luteimonas sp.]
MKPLPLSRIAQWTGGRLRGTDVPASDMLIDAIATDTRTLDASDGRAVLFVALKGEHFDGHDHVAAAADAGARAALVSREFDIALPQVVVADTERALATFAAALQHTRTGKVIAITGSNGKTSVKALLLSILQYAGEAYANPGNRNNEIGLPLAVLDAPEDAQFAIYEMGAGKPGDIAYLTAIARPDVALVNNIAPAHLERMGSLLGVADTKAAIYDALPNGGVAVINADDAFAPYFAERAHGRRLIRFGLESSADIIARDIAPDAEGTRFVLVTPQGEAMIALALPGRHNVLNALAAAALALGAGASLDTIRDGLGAARAVAGRMVTHRLPNGVVLIDDSYNANPGSLNAAIDTLTTGGGENWLVLGDMRELGADAEVLHAEAGRRARAAGIARLFALGPLSAATATAFGAGAEHFDSHVALADALRAALKPDVRVLIKGSRGSAMDRIVTALLPDGGGDAHAA